MSEEERKSRADEVLDNSGAREDLYEQVDRLLEKYWKSI
jgi:dephospho-CoA kinase